MTRPQKVIFSVVFLTVAVGLAGFAVFLRGQGLPRADSWVTVVGFFVTGVPGVVFAFLAWRHPATGTGGQEAPRGGVRQRIVAKGGTVEDSPQLSAGGAGPVSQEIETAKGGVVRRSGQTDRRS